MIDKLVQLGRRIRRNASRTRWTARFLRRPAAAPSDEPGLVILQIDGLSRTEFEAALARGRLPNLRKLIQRGHYDPISFYSGCASTTPAVQGETMYGVRCAVPAFQFLDRAQRKVVRMFDPQTAGEVASRLASIHEPLLTGGCSYSNIYGGGAAEARFCAETLDEEPRRLLKRPVQLATMTVLYFGTIMRVLALALLEVVIALGDMVRGVAAREDWRAELKFISSRVAVSIVMREYLRVMVKLAIEEGRPIIYANFLGYDEQAHRRGPHSLFAHWVLKGIDGVIGDISQAARRASHRDYEVLVFSDHGQERVRLYDRVRGSSIQSVVEQALAEGPLAGRHVRPVDTAHSRGRELDQRARRLLRIRRGQNDEPQLSAQELRDDVVVTALGPLGHIYVPTPLSAGDKSFYAQRLVMGERVPTVVYRDDAGEVWAHNLRGRWALDSDAAQVFGPDHPFLSEVTVDLAALCRHENAGDLLILGWDPVQDPMTFVLENGAHGSVGEDEVRGFALVPDAVQMTRRRAASGEAYIRGEDIYQGSRAFLGRAASVARPTDRTTLVGEESRFRVMTYNVHSCIGLDGKVRPDRILQVIRSAGADVIALQEVDANRQRSSHADQARYLGERLEMAYHYFAVLEDGVERYGLAVLSKFSLRHIKSEHLTVGDPRKRSEARGALWVEIDAPGGSVQLINTHFGLTRAERLSQARLLTGDHWLGKIGPDEPVVLCGDLNAGPTSPPCRVLAQRLVDAPLQAAGARVAGSFPSPWSVRRIDHIFVSRHFGVATVAQPRSPTAVMASDHLPVCVELSRHPATSAELPTLHELAPVSESG